MCISTQKSYLMDAQDERSGGKNLLLIGKMAGGFRNIRNFGGLLWTRREILMGHLGLEGQSLGSQ